MTDWPDMFDWIGAQSWSTGKVGTYGCSYLGEGQILAAQTRHPRHVAAIAQAAGGNLGRVGRRREFWGSVEGGAFSISINFGWMPVFASTEKGAKPMPSVDLASYFRPVPVIDMPDRAGSPSWDWRNFLERSPDDPWWDRQGYLTADDSVGVATLHVTSWFDLAAEALESARIFQANAINDRARDGQYAIVSPTVHCASEAASAQTMVGDVNVGDARLRYWETYSPGTTAGSGERTCARRAPQGPVLHDRPQRVAGVRPLARGQDARDRDLPGQRWWRQHAQWQWSPDESRPDARTRRHLHLRSRPAGPGARRFDLLYGESQGPARIVRQRRHRAAP
ncbi:MAG: hypothetical protein IPK33_11670 [Gemmatimonadetes bacterium]|nr:hypothetical protein [Gemmatimonadota bacterium]